MANCSRLKGPTFTENRDAAVPAKGTATYRH